MFRSFRRIVDNSFRNFNFANAEKKLKVFDFVDRRHQRGFPPRKPDANSLGDAINWEWIFDSAELLSSNVLIVSRDGDYGLLGQGLCYLNDWLSQEFKSRVSPKRKAELIPSLSAALKKLNVKVTPAEKRKEQNLISRSLPPPRYPAFWNFLLKVIKNKNPAISTACKALRMPSPKTTLSRFITRPENISWPK